MRLTDNALRAIQAVGVSGEDFKLRQEAFDSLKKSGDSGLWVQREAFDMYERLTEAARDARDRFLLDQFKEELTVKDRVPVTMEIDGVTTVVGEAVIEVYPGDDYTVVRALLHGGQELVSKLRRNELSHFSLGTKADAKKSE